MSKSENTYYGRQICPFLILRTCPNTLIFANFDATVLCDYWVDSKKFGTFSYLRVEQNPKMSSTRRWHVDGTSNIRRSKSLPGGRRKDASTQQFHKARSPQLLGRFWYFLVFSVSTFPHVHNHVNGSLMERQWTVNQPSNRSISKWFLEGRTKDPLITRVW